jgi:hypothetical protein
MAISPLAGQPNHIPKLVNAYFLNLTVVSDTDVPVHASHLCDIRQEAQSIVTTTFRKLER